MQTHAAQAEDGNEDGLDALDLLGHPQEEKMNGGADFAVSMNAFQ